MVKKKNFPFNTIMIVNNANSDENLSTMFDIRDNPRRWIIPVCDTIIRYELLIYGIPDEYSDPDDAPDEIISIATKIGNIQGCYIANELIINLGWDPYDVCDEADGDLEAMYSCLKEAESTIFDMDFFNDIFYIDEIEFEPDYQGLGYEERILYQVPAIIVRELQVFPSLLMYYPSQIEHDEPECDVEMDNIVLHRLNYTYKNIIGDKVDDNITLFPPKHKIPEKEINRLMGRRNPGETTIEEHRNKDLYKLYRSVGFKEINNSGWLYKRINSIYTKNGLNGTVEF